MPRTIGVWPNCSCKFWSVHVIAFRTSRLQFIPRNMHTVFALLCFVVVIHWLIFPYPSGLLHWHCGNLTIAPVPAKQPWWIWIHTSCEFIMNAFMTTTKQSTTKACAYFLGYTVFIDSKHEVLHFNTQAIMSGVHSRTAATVCNGKLATISRVPSRDYGHQCAIFHKKMGKIYLQNNH